MHENDAFAKLLYTDCRVVRLLAVHPVLHRNHNNQRKNLFKKKPISDQFGRNFDPSSTSGVVYRSAESSLVMNNS